MIGLWVAVALVIVAFFVGRIWGRREGLTKHLVEEITGDVQDIEMIVKYHCDSLPLMAKELMDNYAENRKFHEGDGEEMMRAVAFHYSRITDNLVTLALKNSTRAEALEKTVGDWFTSIISKTENAEAAFVQQIRMAADPKFREHLSEVNQKGFDRFAQSYGYLERYWEHTVSYRKENPWTP